MRKRKRVAGVVAGVGVLVGAAVCGGYGFVVEPRYRLDIVQERAIIEGLPAAWRGRRLALIADLQVGMWWGNPGMVSRAVEAAVGARPQAVLVAGDLVYHAKDSDIEEAVRRLSPIVDAGIPLVVVLGNHDYGLGDDQEPADTAQADRIAGRLREIGATVLRNEVHTLRVDGEPLHIAGLDDEWADRAQPGSVLETIPAGEARIWLAHNPILFRDLPASSAPLMVAGHTHGGQLRLPFLPSESWLDIAKGREVIADGWAREGVGQAGNRLYVNRGIGMSLVPVRVNCRPELTVFTLDGGSAGDLRAPHNPRPPGP